MVPNLTEYKSKNVKTVIAVVWFRMSQPYVVYVSPTIHYNYMPPPSRAPWRTPATVPMRGVPYLVCVFGVAPLRNPRAGRFHSSPHSPPPRPAFAGFGKKVCRQSHAHLLLLYGAFRAMTRSSPKRVCPVRRDYFCVYRNDIYIQEMSELQKCTMCKKCKLSNAFQVSRSGDRTKTCRICLGKRRANYSKKVSAKFKEMVNAKMEEHYKNVFLIYMDCNKTKLQAMIPIVFKNPDSLEWEQSDVHPDGALSHIYGLCYISRCFNYYDMPAKMSEANYWSSNGDIFEYIGISDVVDAIRSEIDGDLGREQIIAQKFNKDIASIVGQYL